MPRVISVLVLVMLSLAGCGTPQYRATYDECYAYAHAKYPPNIVKELVQRTRYETVPDTAQCLTTPLKKLSALEKCLQRTKQIAIPYTAMEDVDLNQGRRRSEALRCTRSTCIIRYGNKDCNPGK